MNTTIKSLVALACLLLAPSVPAAPFLISPDGTEVTDIKTGLVWRRCSEGQSWDSTIAACLGSAANYNHEQALERALTQTGWRLPNIKELSSIVDHSQSSPAIDGAAFPGTSPYFYWSSTPSVIDSSRALDVYFGNGSGINSGRGEGDKVRLVR